MDIDDETYREWRRTGQRAARKAGAENQMVDDIADEAIARLLAQEVLPEPPKAWLYKAATNLAHDEWRRRPKRGRAQMPLTNPNFEGGDNPYPSELQKALGTGHVRQQILIPQMLELLNDREKQFLLAQATGAPLKEIAQRHGVTEATVKTTIARARKKIRQRFDLGPDDLDLA